jgi:hypothetical protein
MGKIGIRYGVVCTVLLSLGFGVTVLMGKVPFTEVSYLVLDVIILGILIYFSITEFRHTNGGELFFWQGMSLGFLTYAIGSLLFFGVLISWMFADEQLLQNYITQALQVLEESKTMYVDRYGAEQYENQVKTLQETTIINLSMSAVFKKLLVGLFVKPIISLFLRRKN